ncbi:phage minor tail protein L [Pseudomonas tussilaginis]|uniref:phage minor tail protein L n=1 Tax=Pseudomonas putida TaxID=303 RepID=UPI0023645741|nr:phage minor tail protein L [Pseudomonas putida]MDD1979011.1 phage minor tail protein L [Pseudomonas putida]
MITADDQKLEPGSLIQLLELDGESRGMGTLRYHAHQWNGPIYWKGQAYQPRPFEVGGFGRGTEGSTSTPMLKLGNLDGVIIALCVQFHHLVGIKVTVRETYAKYLDAANFPGGNPSASDQERTSISFINVPTSIGRQEIVFGLAPPTSVKGQMLPGGLIMNRCEWCLWGEYRGPDCNYTGIKMFDADGNPVDDPALDRCGGRLSDCKKRHGENNPLPFGGVPGAGLV